MVDLVLRARSAAGIFGEVPSIDVNLDGFATPEQISVVVDASNFSASATATCRFRTEGGLVWTEGHPLFRVRPNFSGDPAVGTVDDVFAWTIIDLVPGTAYDVEITVDDGTVSVGTLTTTTRSLPAAAGPATVVIPAGSNTATIASLINNAPAGAVVEFENGEYTITGISLTSSGTVNSPKYIRGESREGVILRRTTQGSFFSSGVNISNIVIENLTMEGTGVDQDPNGSYNPCTVFNQGQGATNTRITIRNTIATGIDRGWYTYNAQQALIYDNTWTGNNLWSQSPVNFLRTNRTWDDDGCNLSGTSNCAFNNSMKGFGDTFSYSQHLGSDVVVPGRCNHVFRNDIRNSCDDTIEVDHSIRNCSFYDNRAHNTINATSLDPLYGGPWLCARNIWINTFRTRLHKWNDNNTGQFLYNNTFISTVHDDPGIGSNADFSNWYQPTNGAQRSYGYRNNVHVYRGGGSTPLWIESTTHNPIDWTHNAWYPDRQIQFNGQNFSSLAAAIANSPTITPIFSGATKRFANDVVITDAPFTVAIALGADANTELSATYTPGIASGNAKNSGAVIPNITDGFTGAAPDRGAIIEGRAVPVYGDRTIAEGLFPSWYPASAGVIVEIPTSNTAKQIALADGAASYPSTGSTPPNLTQPWSGGDIVKIGGQPYMVISGGGHSDGSYNGQIKFGPLAGAGSDTPTWSLFLAASEIADVRDAPEYADGRAAACHTYNHMVGVDDGLYFTATDAIYSTGNSNDSAYRFTPAGQTQLASNNRSNCRFGTASHYNGKLYYLAQAGGSFDRLRIYDIVSNTWSSEPNADTALMDSNYLSSAVDTLRGGLLITDGSNAFYWNLSTLARSQKANAPSGFVKSLVYDSDRDTFVSYVSNSQQVQEVSAASLAAGNDPAWTTRTFTGADPENGEPAGTWGRFRFVPELKGYVLVPTETSGVYFLRST